MKTIRTNAFTALIRSAAGLFSLGILLTGGEARGVAATGGTMTTNSGIIYHTFNYPGGTLDVTSTGPVEYLVVAGGGGGGFNVGGGGGAGGVLTGTVSVAKQGYTITVGAGGGGSGVTLIAGTNGANSEIVGLVGPAIGGGGGASKLLAGTGQHGKNGGSGGGAGIRYLATDGGTGTVNQGYNGGGCNYTDSTHDAGAGGGGASAPGQAGWTTVGYGGNGGNGVAWPTGSGNYYGGGGGGGGLDGPPSAGGSGGQGGGGAGGTNAFVGQPGINGTGGGGGGGGGGAKAGGNGGTGIVIVRYALPVVTATKLVITSAAKSTVAGVASTTITVQRQDASSSPVTADATISVALSSDSTGTPTFNPVSPLTITSGSSDATFTYTDTKAGTPTITAISSGLANGTQQETVTPASASTLTVSGFASLVTAGTPGDVIVTAKDAHGNTVTDYAGTITFSVGLTDSDKTVPANYTFLPGDNGTKTFSGGVTLKKAVAAGGQSLTATDTVTGSINGTQSGITVNPGAADATQSTLTPTSASLTANGTATQVLTVQAKDACGNNLTSDSATVAITQQSGSGTIGTTTYAGSGSYTVTVTSPAATGSGVFVATLNSNPVKNGTGSQTAATISYVPGAADATQSTLTPTSASLTANGTATQVLTVQAKDACGNNLTSDSATVAITKQSGSGTISAVTYAGSGTYTATVTAPAATGSGVFVATLSSNPVKNGTGSQTTSTIPYVPGAAHHITITSSIADLVSGTTRGIMAEIRDANENLRTGDNSTSVSFAKTAGAGTVSGVPNSATASGGIATLQVTGASVGPVELTASAGGVPTAGTTAFNVTLTGASAYKIEGNATMTAGDSQNLTITALDADGNTLTSFTQDKALSFYGLTNSPGGTAATISDTNGSPQTVNASGVGAFNTTLTFVNGTGTVSGANNGVLKAYKATASAVTLHCSDGTASSESGTGAAGLSLTVNPATASTLAVGGFASPATAGVAGDVTVAAKDAYGNTDTNYAGTIAFTVGVTDNGKTLPGNFTFVPGTDHGTKTFSGGVTLTKAVAAGGQSLTATDTVTGSINGTQSGITVNAGTATVTTVETLANGSGTVAGAGNVSAGGSVTVYAITRDTYSNFVANSVATWTLQNTSGNVVSGDLVGGGASAVFTGHLLGSANIQADVGGITGMSGLKTVIAGSATQTRVETLADGSGVVSGVANVTAGGSVTVYAITRDSQGNFVANSSATWSLVNSAGGVVSGDLVGGGTSAVFTGHVIGGANIQADVGGITGQSSLKTVIAGTAVATTVETLANGSGAVSGAENVAAGASITVYAITRDSQGNFVANPSATWSLINITASVVSGDLVSGGASAVFTGNASGNGSANIQAVADGFTGQSGLKTVIVPTIVKASTGAELTNSASWIGGTAPSSLTKADWTGTSLGGALTLVASKSWNGIQMTDATADPAISGAGTLTLGASGIDLSTSEKNMTIANALTLGSSQTWNVNAAKTLAASGGVSGTGIRLTKKGGGTLTLSGASPNTFTGGVTLDSGTVNINKATALGTIAGTFIINGGNIDNTSAALVTVGAQPITMNSDFTFIGTTNLKWGAGATTLGTAAGTSRTITVNNTLTLGGAIADGTTANQLIKAGGGTLTLSGANTFSGGLNINDGTLTCATSTSSLGGSGTGAVYLGDTTGSANASLIHGYNNQTFANPITVQSGTTGNTLTIGASAAAGTFSGMLTLNKGVIITGGSSSLTLSGKVTGSGGIVLASNTLVLNSVSNDSDFSGGVTINSGATIKIYTSKSLGSGVFTINDGATFDNANNVPVAAFYNNAQIWNGSFTYAGAGRNLDLGTGNVTMNANVQVAISGGFGYGVTIGGNISGSGYSLTKAGSGPLTLGGNNNFNGLTINAGTVTVTSDNNLGTAAGGVTFTGNGTLSGAISFGLGRTFTLGNGFTATLSSGVTVNGPVTGPGGITVPGNLTLANSGNNFMGPLSGTAAGTISLASIGDEAGAGQISLGNATTAAVNFEWTGGAKALSTRQFSLVGTTGAIKINNNSTTGALTIGTDLAVPGLGSKTLTLGGTYNGSANTFVGKITNPTGFAISLTKADAGIWTLSGANTYSGVTTISAAGGTLRIGVDSVGTVDAITSSALGTGGLTISGGALSSDGATERTILNAVTFGGNSTLGDATHNGALTFSNTVALGAATRTVTNDSPVTFAGVIGSAGAFGITKRGSGTMTLSAANTYTGVTTIASGMLSISANSGLGDPATGAQLSLGGGTLQLNGTFALDNGGANSRAVALTANSTIDITDGYAATISGVISGAGFGYTKTGAGTLILSATNTHSGVTTISNGTLRVLGQTGTNTLQVIAGSVGGNGRIAGPVTIADSALASLYPNNGGSGGTLTISNNVSFLGGNAKAKFDVSASAGGANDKVVLANRTLAITGNPQITIKMTGASLDTADYVLFDAGASGSISGSFSAVPAWDGPAPANSDQYSITMVGKQVLLDYTSSTSPIAVDDAATAWANAPVILPVTTNDANYDPLIFSLLTAQTWGSSSLSVTNGTNVYYRAPAGSNGVDTFQYVITNASGAATGTVSVTVAVDANPPGTPTLTSPADGSSATNGRPGYTWSAATDGESGIGHYEIWLDSTTNSAGAALTYTPGATLSLGQHTWQVRAVDVSGNAGAFSTPWTNTVTDGTPPAAPVLVSPTNNAATSNTTVTFIWNTATDVSGILRYDIWLNSATNDAGANTNYTSGPLGTGTNTWRVRAVDGAGNTGAFSTARAVIVDTAAPSVPTLVSPTNTAVVTGVTPTFTWAAATDTDSGIGRYDILIDSTTNSAGTSTNYTPSPLGVGAHTWQVRAADKAGNASDWSGQLTFTVALQTPYWQDQDSTWSNAANWSTGIKPQTGEIAIFTNAVYNIAPTSSVNAYGGLDFRGAGNFSFMGNSTQTLSATDGYGIWLESTAGAVSNGGVNFALAAAQSYKNDSASPLFIGGTVTNAGYRLTLDGSGAGESRLTNSVSGAGGLTVNRTGSGAAVLSGGNTYSGGTALSNGVLVVNHTAALGIGPVTLATGTLQLASALTISSNLTGNPGAVIDLDTTTLTVNQGGDSSFAGVITNAGGLIKGGTGALTLSGANTYGGITTLSTGTLKAAHAQAFGLNATAAALTLNGGLLDLALNSSVNAYNVAMGGTATIASDRASGGVAITHTLGTLSIGAQTLYATNGANVTSGTAGLVFGATALSGAAAFDVASGVSLTLGALSGDCNFTKQGGGTLMLINAGTRASGATTLTTGTLNLGDPAALGTTGTALILNGGTLALTMDTAVNACSVTNTASTTIILDRASPGSGVNHTLGTLRAATASTLTVTNGANVTPGTAVLTFGATVLGSAATTPTFDVGDGVNLTLGALSASASSASFIKQGAGTLTLNSVSTRGNLGDKSTLNGGTLVLGDGKALAGGTYGNQGNTYLNGGTLQFNQTTNTMFFYGAGLFITNGNVALVNNVNETGVGQTATLDSGALTIGTVTMTVTNGSGVGSGTAGLALSKTLNLAGSPTFSIGNSAGVTALLTLNAVTNTTASTQTITVRGSGNLAQSAAWLEAANTYSLALDGTFAGSATLDKANTFSGGVTIGGGRMRVGVASVGTVGAITSSALGTGTLMFNGGGLSATGTTARTILNPVTVNANVTLGHATDNGALTFSNTVALGSSPRLLTINSPVTFAGDLGGSGALTLAGTSSLTLSAANTFSSAMTVDGGATLILNASADLANAGVITVTNGAFRVNSAVLTGSSAITVDNGGVLDGTGTIAARAVIVNNGGTVNPGTAGTVGTLTATNVTFNNGSMFVVDIGAGANIADKLALTGDLTVNSGAQISFNVLSSLNQANYTLMTYSNYNSGTFTASGSVPSGYELQYSSTNLTLVQTGGAANSSWNVITNGLWSVAGNWVGSVVADGANNTADFSTLNITNDVTVSLDTPRAIGNLTFGDTTSSSAGNWILDNHSDPLNVLTLAGTAPTITVNTLGTGKATIISNTVAGTDGLAKAGAGILVLEGTNTYTGVTAINNGTLAVATLANGGSVSPIGQSGNSAANLVINGGALRVTNAVAPVTTDRGFTIGASGATIDSSGSDSAALTWNGAPAYDAAGVVRRLTLAGVNTNANTFGATIGDNGAGAMSLVKTNAGTWVLGAANGYTGGTTLGGGTLSLGSSGAVGMSGNLSFKGGTLQFSAANTTDYSARIKNSTGAISLNLNGQTLAFASDIDSSNTGGLTLSGSGVITLSGNNAYSGNTTFGAGQTLNIGSTNALGTGTLVASGAGTFDNSSGGPLTITNNFTLSSSSTNAGTQNLVISGVTTVSGNSRTLTVNNNVLTLGSINADLANRGLTKTGAGTLTITGAAGALFQGGFTLSAGNLIVGNNTALGSGGLTWAAGTLAATNTAISLANNITFTAGTVQGASALTLGGTFTVVAGTRTNTINNSALTTLDGNVYLSSTESASRSLTINGTGNVAIRGVIANNSLANTSAANLTYAGSGTLTLSGENTYSGITTIASGTLAISNSTGSATGGGAVIVTNGATLTGAGSLDGWVDLRGTNSPGFGSLGVGRLYTGSNTWHGGGTYVWNLHDGSTTNGYDQIIVSGSGVIDVKATSGNPFTIRIVTPPGGVGNLVESNVCTIARAGSGGFVNFSADKFIVDSSQLRNTLVGTILLTTNGADMNLIFIRPKGTVYSIR